MFIYFRKGVSASLTSLCLMSHHPFLSAYRDILTLLRQLIDACNHRCNQNENLQKYVIYNKGIYNKIINLKRCSMDSTTWALGR